MCARVCVRARVSGGGGVLKAPTARARRHIITRQDTRSDGAAAIRREKTGRGGEGEGASAPASRATRVEGDRRHSQQVGSSVCLRV